MKINNSYILLKDICCFAYHGVAPQENIIGNEYIINLKLKVDISQAIHWNAPSCSAAVVRAPQAWTPMCPAPT